MGREKRTEKRDHFTSMVRNLMETPAWRALSPTAQALYPWIRLEWHGARANNNGKIRLSIRQAASKMGCSKHTAAKAFHELQAKGFVYIQEPASLGIEGVAKSPSYEITEIEMPTSSDNGGRKLYLKWKEGVDFPIQKAAVHNKRGGIENLKPCPKDSPNPVLVFRT